MHSIQNFIHKKVLEKYKCVDINIYQENLFHTKMLLKDFKLEDYLFANTANELSSGEKNRIHDILEKEMTEIFYSKNIY